MRIELNLLFYTIIVRKKKSANESVMMRIIGFELMLAGVANYYLICTLKLEYVAADKANWSV